MKHLFIKKLLFPTLLMMNLLINATAQVALQPIVEHFTNTKCSVCASRNPGLYANLNANPEMTHISIHPSSPYPNCILSQQNALANDARTDFYGVYGGTPRIVINGDVFSAGTSYTSATLFTPFIGLTTAFSIDIQQVKYSGTNTVHTSMTIKKEAASALTEALLFVGLLEDTVFVNGGNGELEHYHVFRRAVTAPEGMAVDLPSTIGDSIVLEFTSTANPVWDFSRIYSLAILQNAATLDVLQTGKTDVSPGGTVSAADDRLDNIGVAIFPNPASGILNIETLETDVFQVEIYAPLGSLVHKETFRRNASIDLAPYSSGLYYVRIFNDRESMIKKVVFGR